MSNGKNIEAALVDIFEEMLWVNEEEYSEAETKLAEALGDKISDVSSYESTLVTCDKGVVIDLENGTRVYLTIQVNSGCPIQ